MQVEGLTKDVWVRQQVVFGERCIQDIAVWPSNIWAKWTQNMPETFRLLNRTGRKDRSFQSAPFPCSVVIRENNKVKQKVRNHHFCMTATVCILKVFQLHTPVAHLLPSPSQQNKCLMNNYWLSYVAYRDIHLPWISPLA